jgi:hypothetical protein
VYWRDDYVLGEANGTIHWDRPWTSSSGEKSFNRAEHVHVVDGGSTATLVVLQGPKSDYHFTTQMTGLGLEADLSWVDSIGHEHLIGQLYRVNPVLFLPTTISSSAAGADTTSAAEPQFMLHLDGSAVTVQTALAGQAALTVDPLFVAHPAHSVRTTRRGGTRPPRRCRELCHRQGPQDRNRTARLRFRLRR